MTKKKQTYSSVFEASAKIEHEKQAEKGQASGAEAGQPRTSFDALKGLDLPPLPAAPKAPLPAKSQEEMVKQLEQCKKLHEQLKKQVDKVFTVGRTTPATTQKVLENPRLFSSKEWSRIQAQKDEIKKRLDSLVPRPQEPPKEEGPGAKGTEPPPKKPPEPPKKKQKGSMSKKGWLPMH